MGAPISPASPGAEPVAAAKPRGWSLIAFLALVLFVTILVLDAYAGGSSKVGPLLSVPIWLPYLFVFLRLRGKKPKSGLALAIGMSCAMLLPAAWLIFYARSWDASWRVQAALAVIVAAQFGLAMTSIRAWRGLSPEKGQWRTVIANLAYAVIALFIVTSFLWRAPNRISEDEQSALWTLQTIQKGASTYSQQYGVYPAHLAGLDAPPGDEKPSCSAASLLSLAVSSAEPDRFESIGWGGGYVFEYQARPASKSSAGCVGTTSYVVQARPVIYRKTGRRSFLLDETGTFRATSEDRPALSTDPSFSPAR